MAAATYIDDQRVVRTYRLPLIEKFGCSKELSSRLGYARAMCERMAASRSGSGGGAMASVGTASAATTSAATASASWTAQLIIVCDGCQHVAVHCLMILYLVSIYSRCVKWCVCFEVRDRPWRMSTFVQTIVVKGREVFVVCGLNTVVFKQTSRLSVRCSYWVSAYQ